jgi:hypothetical protein
MPHNLHNRKYEENYVSSSWGEWRQSIMGLIIYYHITTNECITTTTKSIEFGEPLLMAKSSQKIDTRWTCQGALMS